MKAVGLTRYLPITDPESLMEIGGMDGKALFAEKEVQSPRSVQNLVEFF